MDWLLKQKRTLYLYDSSFGIVEGYRPGNEGKTPPGTAHLMQKRALIAMQYSALHNRTWITPTVHPWLTKQKAMKSFDPQLPRQTFPDGDPRALNNSPPGCCLPRLRLGRAVRVPSTHKKRKTRTQCVLVFLGAMEGTRTPGLLIRSQSLYPAELPTHVLRARNMMYYSTGSELCQHFFAIIFLLFFRNHGKAQTFCVFVIPFLYQL